MSAILRTEEKTATYIKKLLKQPKTLVTHIKVACLYEEKLQALKYRGQGNSHCCHLVGERDEPEVTSLEPEQLGSLCCYLLSGNSFCGALAVLIYGQLSENRDTGVPLLCT